MAWTLAQLRTRLRQRVDMVNSQFVTDAECNQLLNTAGARLHDLLITADPERYMTTAPITLVNGTESYSLPTDFHTMLQLFATTGSGATLQRVPLRKFNLKELSSQPSPYSLGTYAAPVVWYRLEGNKVYIWPVAASVTGWALELWYAPQYVDMVADGDTVDYGVVSGWDEYIIDDAAINIRLKEESDVSGLMARLQEFEVRVVTTAKYRDSAEPSRVVNVNAECAAYGA